jgi:hypothetical protein
MTVETDLVTVIGGLCSGRVFPDVAPIDTARPYVTYQQVGGLTIDPIDGDVPNLKNARMQVNVWADTRSAANVLMRQIEDALRPPPYNARPLSALIARYEEMTKMRGAQQDFSIWWE